jgi:hypothetical protein
MMKTSYDPTEMLAIAKNLRIEAETADPAERDTYLSLASEYEEQVQRSFLTPVICNVQAPVKRRPPHFRRSSSSPIRDRSLDERALGTPAFALETVSDH